VVSDLDVSAVREPDMNESIYRDIFHELYRYPYLTDENRNERDAARAINGMFNSQSSVALEYPGGYVVLRDISQGKAAELVWIHRNTVPLGRKYVRLLTAILDEAINNLGLKFVWLKTPDISVARFSRQFGFRVDEIIPGGFSWHGDKQDLYLLKKEN
jgi:hypothetical protein